VGRQVQQHQSPYRGADHGLDCIISRGIGMIPRHVDRAGWMLVDQGLQQFDHFAPPLRPYDR
jgi:hypothetical protein